jgi:UDP-N-acetyl-2-amino-2-deoxyglucuronate dehydrogenase
MRKLRIGIIGCGTILPVHLDSIHSFEQAELVVVCDLNEGVAKSVARSEGCRYVTEFKEVLQDESVDVVHILTPHYLHVPMAIQAIQARKHVVLEKPVGIGFDELKQLKEKAERSSQTIGVTLQNRFNPTTIKMKEIIEEGKLGNLISAKAVLTWCRKEDYYSKSDWRGKLKKEGGGLLINQAIHTLDLLEYIGGPIKHLDAYIKNFTHPEIEVEDTAMIALNYESGATGSFYGTNSYGENSDVELGFVYEKGELVLKEQHAYLKVDGKSTLLAHDLVVQGNKSYWGKSHQQIIHNIYEAILTGNQPKVTLEDAIRATELVLLSYKQKK